MHMRSQISEVHWPASRTGELQPIKDLDSNEVDGVSDTQGCSVASIQTSTCINPQTHTHTHTNELAFAGHGVVKGLFLQGQKPIIKIRVRFFWRFLRTRKNSPGFLQQELEISAVILWLIWWRQPWGCLSILANSLQEEQYV